MPVISRTTANAIVQLQKSLKSGSKSRRAPSVPVDFGSRAAAVTLDSQGCASLALGTHSGAAPCHCPDLLLRLCIDHNVAFLLRPSTKANEGPGPGPNPSVDLQQELGAWDAVPLVLAEMPKQVGVGCTLFKLTEPQRYGVPKAVPHMRTSTLFRQNLTKKKRTIIANFILAVCLAETELWMMAVAQFKVV